MTQEEFIEILSIDLRVSRIQRNALISSIVGRTIKYLDELTIAEKSKVIDDFKSRKPTSHRAPKDEDED